MTMTLLVKGNRYQTAIAAAKRGVPFVFRREIDYRETVGQVDDQHFAAVTAWFMEPPTQAPFPKGTLLHYSTVT